MNYNSKGEFSCIAIYNKFIIEQLNSGKTWAEFVKKKDLGIELVNEFLNKHNLKYVYRVIDQKKWDYNRIKYEI